jgi:hypothetical protein
MTLWQDLRYATRLLVKVRWFTAVAAAALALGIGVNATVFTIVNAILIRGISFKDPDRIISLAGVDARGRPTGISRLDFVDRGENNRTFSAMTLILPSPSALTATVREQMRAIEPDLPLFGILTLDQMLANTRFSFRLFGGMFAIFAVSALVLSAVGLYA